MTSLTTSEVIGSFVILNDRGLHTRPSTEIVKCASSFDADVELVYRKLKVNAKSILGVLMLAATKGAKIKVIASGKEAEEVVDSLVALAENQFNMTY